MRVSTPLHGKDVAVTRNFGRQPGSSPMRLSSLRGSVGERKREFRAVNARGSSSRSPKVQMVCFGYPKQTICRSNPPAGIPAGIPIAYILNFPTMAFRSRARPLRLSELAWTASADWAMSPEAVFTSATSLAISRVTESAWDTL